MFGCTSRFPFLTSSSIENSDTRNNSHVRQSLREARKSFFARHGAALALHSWVTRQPGVLPGFRPVDLAA